MSFLKDESQEDLLAYHQVCFKVQYFQFLILIQLINHLNELEPFSHKFVGPEQCLCCVNPYFLIEVIL
jgi:hypothetical protein